MALNNNYYGTPALTRNLLGVSTVDIPDYVLEEFLRYGTKVFLKQAAVKVVGEELIQSGTLKNYFKTRNKFMADIDGDKTIGVNDVSVYYLDDNNNKNVLTVDSIDGSTGQVVLHSVPSSTIDVMIDYSYYQSEIDWDLADLAVSYYAAFMWAGKELYLVPPRFFLGNLRINLNEPWMNYKRMFDEIIRLSLTKPIDKVAYDRMVLYPRSESLVTPEQIWWYKLTGLIEG